MLYICPVCFGDQNEEQFYTVSWARGVDGKPFVAAGGERGIIRVINVNDKMVHKVLLHPLLGLDRHEELKMLYVSH